MTKDERLDALMGAGGLQLIHKLFDVFSQAYEDLDLNHTYHQLESKLSYVSINGRARQSCSAIVDQLEQPIRLEPMSTFPVIRDCLTFFLRHTRTWT
jgi:hypothetical protein